MKLIASPFELIVPADHYPAYAKHWVESRREDGPNLHEGFLFLFEVEIILSSLFLGVFTALFFELIHEDMLEVFRTNQVFKLDYYVVLFGVLSMCSTFSYCIVAYVMIRLILPISDSNAYVFFKQQSFANWMIFANVQVCCMLYSCALFLVCALCSCLGGFSVGGTYVVIAAVGLSLIGGLYFAGINFNLAMNSGVFGSQVLIDDKQAFEASSAELDNTLTLCALHNINQYKKPVPANILYRQEQDCRKGKQAEDIPWQQKRQSLHLPLTLRRGVTYKERPEEEEKNVLHRAETTGTEHVDDFST